MADLISDEFLETRVKKLHNRLAATRLQSRGLELTTEALGQSLKDGTVSVLETTVNGKPVRIVTTNNTAFYKMLKERPQTLLLPGEILGSPPLFVQGPLEEKPPRTRRPRGYYKHPTPPTKARPKQSIHAEQLGANDARRMGAKSGRIATSNAGCTDLCVALLDEEFPEFRHVNPRSPKPDPAIGTGAAPRKGRRPRAHVPPAHPATASARPTAMERGTTITSLTESPAPGSKATAGDLPDLPVRRVTPHTAAATEHARRGFRARSLVIGVKAWRAVRVVGKVLITCFVPLKALDILLEVAMAIWDHEREKKEREEQEKQRTLEAVFTQGAATIEKGMQAIVSSAATVQGFMDTWERNTRNPGFHYARLRAVLEVQSYVGIVSARAERIDSMTNYRIVSLNVKAVAGYRDFEVEEHGEEKEVEKSEKDKMALIQKGHGNPDLVRKMVRNRSLGYTIVPPLHTPFDVVVTRIGNLFVDVTNVITEVAGTGSLWLKDFPGFDFKKEWKEQFDLEPQFNAPLDPAVCEYCLRYLFASAKVLSRHPLEQQDLEGTLEDPRKGYRRRFELLQTRVDHDRAPYNKNFSDFVRQVGRLVKSGRADADVAAAVKELQLGARSIWNDLIRIEDNIKNPEYYYLGPNYKPRQ